MPAVDFYIALASALGISFTKDRLPGVNYGSLEVSLILALRRCCNGARCPWVENFDRNEAGLLQGHRFDFIENHMYTVERMIFNASEFRARNSGCRNYSEQIPKHRQPLRR